MKDRECWMKDEMCERSECRHYIDLMDIGNCVKRVDKEYTLREIGMVMGITRERVRQILEALLLKLRKKFPRD